MGVMACLIDLRFVADEADRAVQLLLSVVERIGAKTGCSMCSTSRDVVDPNRVRYNEIWTSESSFHAHVRSQEFRHVLVAMDMCCERPRVVIGSLSGPTGLEYLQELREGSEPVLDPDA